MHSQIQTGIPLIYEAIVDTTSNPMPVGSLHGLTLGAHSKSWGGAKVQFYSSPVKSTDMADYAPVLFYDGTPFVLLENGSYPVPIIRPGSYLIAVLSQVSGTTEAVTAYIG